jgi:hypothetical protein
MIHALLEQQTKDKKVLTTKILKPTQKVVENVIKEYDNLDIFAKIRLERELESIKPSFSDDLKTFLFDRIQNAIDLTLTTYLNHLSKTHTFNQKQISELHWECLLAIVAEPFMGMILEERVDRSVNHTFTNLMKDISFAVATHGIAKQTAQETKPQFLTNGQVVGGSALLWNTRLLVGEQNRAYQLTAKRLLQLAEIEEVLWVPHEDKPSSAQCLEYAKQGSFKLKDIPNYPHTGCCCSLVPIIL